MKQRVAIARGMAMEPDILLMDEPFAALDALTRRKMQDELLQLWDDTRFTVLFVTHSIPEAIKIGSRILLLSPHPGQVKAELNSLPRDAVATGAGGTQALEHRIHSMLFADEVEGRRCRMAEPSSFARPEHLSASRSTPRPSASWRSRCRRGSGSATSPRCASSRSSSLLALIWEVYARWLDNPLLFPTFAATIDAFVEAIASGELPGRALTSLQVLLTGYAAGIALRGRADHDRHLDADRHRSARAADVDVQSAAGDRAAAARADLVRAGLRQHRLRDHPFGAVGGRAQHAFGLPVGVEHAADGRPQLRPVAAFATSAQILIPAAFPSILTGLKIGWAFAWRTLIAAELVFGVSSGSGGLGWFIYENKNQLEIPAVFAGLFTVILIGLIVENVIFRTVETRTVRRWGMQS